VLAPVAATAAGRGHLAGQRYPRVDPGRQELEAGPLDRAPQRLRGGEHDLVAVRLQGAGHRGHRVQVAVERPGAEQEPHALLRTAEGEEPVVVAAAGRLYARAPAGRVAGQDGRE